MSNKARVEIKYIDVTEERGYLRIALNGFLQPTIRIDFDPGNDAELHDGLAKAIEAVFSMGFVYGERAGKCKVRDLLEWAETR